MKQAYATARNSEQSLEAALNVEFSQLELTPEWIMLLPPGPTITGRDGRNWQLPEPRALVDAFVANNADLPVDQEHSTEIKGRKGEPAPAIGWIKALEVRYGQVWGRVDWTEQGKQIVGNKQYRYVSPVFVYEKDSKTIVRLTSVGLTNQPNLHLQALNQQQKEPEMKNLLKLLGLAEDATEEMAINALKQLQGDLQTATNRAEQPDLQKFVPRADYDQLQERASNAEAKLEEIETEQRDSAINSAIDQALKDGKIAPASKDYYTAMCQQDGGLEQFQAFLKTAPKIAADSNLDGKDPDQGTKALNAEQQKIADMFGNSAEDLKKYGQD